MPSFVQEHLQAAASKLQARCQILRTTLHVAADHEPVHQLLVYFARHLAVSMFTHHFRAVPIQATLVLANAAQIVVEDILRSVTGSLVQDWQAQLAFAPLHAG
eukprot:3093070-Amphidinium_carterae.1